jgi:hypothetical protein
LEAPWTLLNGEGDIPFANELDLPINKCNHRVQHVSLFDPVATYPLSGQRVSPLLPVEVDRNDEYQEYQVEKVADS